MEDLTSETRPRLFRAGGIHITEAVADPSVTFIEVGDSFGFLLSDAAYDASLDDRLLLENVLWVRCAEEGIWNRLISRKEMLHRSFEEVAVYCHDAGLFVAQDTASEGYFPSPSMEPYAIVFISQEQYEQLHRSIEEEAMEQLLDAVRWVAQGLPGFSFDGESLIAPPNYASALSSHLDHDIMELE